MDCWSPKAAEIFNDWICDKKKISFEKKMVQSGRSFGRVLVHSVDDNIAFCVAQALCDIPRLAILDKDYMSGEHSKNFYITSICCVCVCNIFHNILFCFRYKRCSSSKSRGFFAFEP